MYYLKSWDWAYRKRPQDWNQAVGIATVHRIADTSVVLLCWTSQDSLHRGVYHWRHLITQSSWGWVLKEAPGHWMFWPPYILGDVLWTSHSHCSVISSLVLWQLHMLQSWSRRKSRLFLVLLFSLTFPSFPDGTMIKNPPANAGDSGDADSVSGLERSPGGGNGNPL